MKKVNLGFLTHFKYTVVRLLVPFFPVVLPGFPYLVILLSLFSLIMIPCTCVCNHPHVFKGLVTSSVFSVKIIRLGGGHRREEPVMTRLRLGHGALNKSLKMIGKHETGLCEWCQEEESVEHIIIRCRRYEVQRVIMRNNLRELGVQELTLKGVLSTG